MAYDELLGIRLRDIFSEIEGYTEKKMFGGIAFFLNGNMSCGVHKNHLIVRVGKNEYNSLLKNPIAKEFDVTGKVLTGWIMIENKNLGDDEVLKEWVTLGISFAKSLPAK